MSSIHTSTQDALYSRFERWTRLFVIGLATLFLCVWVSLVWSPSVSAQSQHAVLVRSNPAERSVLTSAPTSVQLVLSESVQLVQPAIGVLDPTGKHVEHGRVTQVGGTVIRVAIDAAKKGTYLVIWQVISQDTDSTSGRFVFSVERASGIWENTSGSGVSPLGVWLQVAARFLHFVGYAHGFGPFVLQVFVLLPLGLAHNASIQRRLLRLVTFGILCLVLAELTALLAQNASLGTGLLFDPSIVGDILSSSFGRVLAQRLGAALLLWVLVGAVKEGSKGGVPIILVLGAILAFIDGEASHAIRSNPVWVGFIANALHIVAMGIWIGGLCSLLVLYRLPEVKNQLATIVLRFGRLATIAVLELGLTGLVLAFLQLKAPINLVKTPYGIVLALKSSTLLIALFLVMLAMRSNNERRIRWWVVEAIVLAVIIVLAGLLVSLPPPIG